MMLFSHLAASALVAAAMIATGPAPAGAPTQPAGPHPAPAPAAAADVASIDGVVTALYESISGPAGQPRDWDRLRSLCRPDTRFLAARELEDGRSAIFALSVDDYIMHNRKYFENGGFFEKEAARRTEEFGAIAHVWSTYESRRTAEAPQPYSRGIYSIQLLKDGDRWWLVSIFWDHEREGRRIPDKYLQTP